MPVFHGGVAVQQLEGDTTHFPTSATWKQPAPASRRPYLTKGYKTSVWHKCVASQNASQTSRRRFGIRQVTSEIGILERDHICTQFVSCTSNLLEQMYDFQKCTMFLQKWISSFQDLLQSLNLEINPIYNAEMCFHMTILPTTTGEMNVRNESCSTFITSFCPNVISAFVKLCKLWNVRPPKLAKILWLITEPCSNREYPRRELWNNHPLKIFVFLTVLWHGLSCKEMCGTLMWVDKQDDTTTLQSIYSMHRWPPLQRRRNEICWIIATCMLSNCSEILIFGKNLTSSYFYGQWINLNDQSKMDPGLWQTPESITNVISLKRRSMWWKTLIPNPQMSNSRVKKLYCICLKTMKL